ncbi:Peroxisomal catalase [Daldinia childiae]|uniref:Peroxisomal catalase n=1 Tax=Daldinia childiae TaxID=326645 RepID=UPI001444D8FE|nr:Peroxisomal catalase [Daldinia childiae]KAF3063824.1 Peroxisomal catalase [Daldinia childiae]
MGSLAGTATRNDTPTPTLTTGSGCPIAKPEGSLRDGKHLLLQDFNLIETLSHFNREKIPERTVHARGAGAYGEFEVTHDISDICNIDMLLGVGKKTPCVTRFSTTTFERGSAESMQDPKGMAVKFFTEEGNWDWVCLNIPMFFIRDPIKFPGLVHAQRRDPQSNLANPNMWWDWICNNHESLHMVLWLYSEFGSMFNYRSMSGYVGHAFKWTMPDGSWKYVHFFLSSDKGPNFEKGETEKNAQPDDPDSATRDLYEAIERGEYPTWTANVQVVDPKDVDKLGFDIFDVTKHWNLGNYPPDIDVIPGRPFGKLTLNRNPQNFFAEVEQLAFSPSHLVPGVAPSEDPLLQARMFAYPDAQRYRLGVNNQSIPANRPKNAYNPQLRDGSGVHGDNYGKVPGFVSASRPMNYGKPVNGDTELDQWLAKVNSQAWLDVGENDYKWPREFWKVLPTLRSPEFQNTIVVNMSKSLVDVDRDLREKVYKTLQLIAEDLMERVRDATESLVSAN